MPKYAVFNFWDSEEVEVGREKYDDLQQLLDEGIVVAVNWPAAGKKKEEGRQFAAKVLQFSEVALHCFPHESVSDVRAAIRQKLNNAEKTLDCQKPKGPAMRHPLMLKYAI